MGTSNTWYDNTYIPSSYTVRYTASTGETIYEQTYPYYPPKKPVKRRSEPELEAGDTAALDNFLGGFGCAKK